MSRTIRLTPSLRLVVEPELRPAVAMDAAREAACDAAFVESSASGLLWLASQSLRKPLPPVLVYWRELAVGYFHDICRLGADVTTRWATAQPPADTYLAARVEAAPPMQGLEYLTVDGLRHLWSEIHQLAQTRAADFPGGAAEYLAAVHPIQHLVGRVTFHLAENKRDEARPFAFLATYTHRVSGRSKLSHLPLKEALKQYAGAGKRDELESLLEPVRRAAVESPVVRELLESRELFQPQAWTIGAAHRFLHETPRLEAAGVVVRVPDWWNPRRPRRAQVQVQLGAAPTCVAGADGLLDFNVDLALDGEPLTAEEQQQLLAADEGLLLLRGKWIEVDGQRLREALDHWDRVAEENPDGLEFVEGMRLLAGTPLDGDAEEVGETVWSDVVSGQWLAETLAKLRDPSGVNGIKPGVALRATLRPYQADGVRWLWFMTGLGLGACLADDMGLGKTIQVIDLLVQRSTGGNRAAGGRRAGKSGGKHDSDKRPSLLVVPASLIGNWKQELQRFAPQLRVFIAHRSEASVEELAETAERPVEQLAGFDLVVTTYTTVRRQAWLADVPWDLAVLDEAQAIKNASAAQSKAVKKLDTRGRIVLTGTPIENHVGDLWSIFDFCSPGLLGSAAQFKRLVKRLNQEQNAAAFAGLRRLIRPYILRRLKTDPAIVPDLPAKTEMRTECGLSKRQAAAYSRAVDRLARQLESAEGIGRSGTVLAVLMQLKQICNHPALALQRDEFPARDSGKFARLASICEAVAARQEKLLVFTQFQSMCAPLADFLAEVFGRPGLVLTGRTAVRKRSELVRRFQDDEGPPFFVISVKAGGSGLNLTAASHVVHFDRWWNPAVENQATDRAFRIGQRRNVLVHKFVCRGTVEERIDQMLADKQGMADKLLDQGAEAMLTEMSNEELLQFVSIDRERALQET